MKSMSTSVAVTGFPFAGFLILGVVLLLLAAGPAGAVTADEERLFNLAEADRWHNEVRALLAKGVSPNAPVGFSLRRAALHVAAEHGASKNLAAMLRAGGNPNLRDGEKNTPLHWASADRSTGGLTADYPAVIRLLVRHGADLHRLNQKGATPLHVAVDTGVGSADRAVVKALLDAGAKPETVDGAGLTALQRFARSGNNEGALVRLLLDAGADPDRKTPGGDAPLHLAVREGSGKPAVVQALLNGGADPCVQDAEGYTPYQLYNGQANAVIQHALDRAQGHDFACNTKEQEQTEDTQQAEGGPGGSGDTGEERPGQAPAMEPFGPNWIVAANQPCQVFLEGMRAGTTYTWSGGCVDGKLSGKGRLVLQFPDGGQTVYDGSMRAGKEHGQGTVVMPGGGRYEGGWREGKYHGWGGLINPDGQGFEGKFQDGNLVCLKNINC